MPQQRCAHCKAIAEPVPPRTGWKIANVFFWIGSMTVGVVFGSLLGLNVVLVPLAVAIGWSVGESARRASSYTCPECHSVMAKPTAAIERETARQVARTHRLIPHHA